MEKGFPDKYQILPAPIERIIDIATRLGRFLSPQTTQLFLSEHYTPEPTDSELNSPADTIVDSTYNPPTLF